MEFSYGGDKCNTETYLMPELLNFLERYFLQKKIFPLITSNKEKASALVVFISRIQTFLDFNPENLRNLRYFDTKKPLFSKNIKELEERFKKTQEELRGIQIKVTEFFKKKLAKDKMDVRYIILAFLIKEFMDSLKRKLEIRSLDDLSINPHISTLLGLKDNVRELIQFNLYQNITRSIVTKWGSFVEELLFYSGSIKPDMLKDLNEDEYEEIKGKLKKGTTIDLVKVTDTLIYLFQIKSGPNTMNVDMVNSLTEVMKKLQNTTFCGKKTKMLLGMTYGKPKQISSQIIGGFKSAGFDPKDYTKIGRDLWDFIGEEEKYYIRVLEILELINREIFGDFSIVREIDDLTQKLEEEWKKRKEYKDKNIWELFM